MNEIDSKLIANFRETLTEQVQNALARRIHAKVRDARSDPDDAARRWPFELIQNAHDAGPRVGREGIAVVFEFIEGVLRFRHDAAPFSMADIAALLTGGSSKDFDAPETTGRFGTGFLVTHVLSERVQVTGVLEVDGERRRFDVLLDRPDDEDLILLNIRESESALGQTREVNDFDESPTATVEYVVDDTSTASTGIGMLESSLPHLFGTCRRLRDVKILRDGLEKHWMVTGTSADAARNGLLIKEISVSSMSNDGQRDEWRVIRGAKREGASGQSVLVLHRSGDNWVVSKPGLLASVFRQLPLLGAPTLSSWVVIDGEFDVDEERASVHVSGGREHPLREAFSALGGLALVATEEAWIDGYRLAQLAMPTEHLGDAATFIWRDILASTANELSRLPLVQTVRAGLLPVVQNEPHTRWVDLISQQLSGVSHADLWKLCAECTEVDPPIAFESEGWSEIAQGWEDLGVPVSWIDLKLLGERASSEVGAISQLLVDADSYKWLARYLDAIGRSWQSSGVVKSHLTHLLPDQHGKLRNPGELRKDGGVDERLKTIAAKIGLDIRSQLLDEHLITNLKGHNLEAGLTALAEVAGDQMNPDEALDTLVQRLADALPADQLVKNEAESSAAATLDVLEYVWTSRGDEARELAWKVPLLAADGTARRAGQRRLMAPPVPAWPDIARTFAKAYPASRVLADRYATVSTAEMLLKALTRWGISHGSLLGISKRDELRDRALRVIASNPDEVVSAVLREPQFMQIALLEPEILNHCKQSRALAQTLLGLVLCYVAREDASWRSTVAASVRTSQAEKQVQLTPSLWLSDLRSKPWIPVEDEDEVTHHPPNPELIRELIDSVWLEDNTDGADLLVRHFGMDALETRLLAASSDDEVRRQLRDRLAKIVEVAGHNPQIIDDLLAKAVQRQRDVNRMRHLGLAVQERVKIALQRRDLTVDDIDRGYDFLVTAVTVLDADTDDVSAYFEVGKYKVEVKATTTGEARLTPLQAATSATDDEFVLCVVDLRSFQGDVWAVDWSTQDVSARCHFLSGVALPMNETLTMVRRAEASEIPARNTTALRYAVRPDLWERGLCLDAWVDVTFGVR